MPKHTDETKIQNTKKVYGEKQFQYTNRLQLLPQGFINYHKQNFVTFFDMKENEFAGKKVLDTGCGPGKHAAVLALMGCDVTAFDLSELNIQKGEEIKSGLNLENINFATKNLMEPLKTDETFDLVSAHNWMQHSENPSRVMTNLVAATKVGGRLYFSLYQGKTFRFLVAQIARSILSFSDYEICERLVGSHFPSGFTPFDNYLDIYLENIFDDFFVPYCHTTTYELLIRDAAKLGCKPITKIPSGDNNYHIDNLALRIGFERTHKTDLKNLCLEFNTPIDEINNDYPATKDIKELADLCIAKYKNHVPDYERCSFCLGLYKIRAECSSFNDEARRFDALSFYLEQSLDDTNWPISALNDKFQKTAENSKPDLITPVQVTKTHIDWCW
ncbi:methyltransferase domain-containing protein [Alphaproteobacteria bacterium]|nr:methyltransferase domain-containing protein [Alphaproteobacteria bacterium]